MRLCLTLVYSRAACVEWTTRMDRITLRQCHEHAFEYLGGMKKYLVYDRMKTVVQGEDGRGGVRLNPGFKDFAQYYGFVPKPTPLLQPGRAASGRYHRFTGIPSFTGLPLYVFLFWNQLYVVIPKHIFHINDGAGGMI